MRRHEIITRLNPAASIAFVAHAAFGALADEVDLTIPLTVASAERAPHIKITAARLARDAIKCVSVMRCRAIDDMFGV